MTKLFFPSLLRSNKVCVILAGGKPVSVETYQENGFVPTIEDLEKAVTPKTKAIMLGYPNNPTGAIISKEQIKLSVIGL